MNWQPCLSKGGGRELVPRVPSILLAQFSLIDWNILEYPGLSLLIFKQEMASTARECHHRLCWDGLGSHTQSESWNSWLGSYVDIMGTMLHMFELFFGPHLYTVREL